MFQIPNQIFQNDPNAPIKGDAIAADRILGFEEGKDGGVYMFLRNVPFPLKGLPFTHIVEGTGPAKKTLKSGIRLLKAYPLLLLLYPWRRRIGKRLLEEYVLIANSGGLPRYAILPKSFSSAVRELYFKALPLATSELKKQLIYIFSMVLEFDNAYRFRLQDAFMELDIKALRENPRRECQRMAELMADRELRVNGTENLRFYWRKLFKYGGLYLWLNPETKNFLCDYLESLDMEKVKFDEVDLYYIYARTERNYMGIEFTERLEMRKTLERRGSPIVAAFLEKLKKSQSVGLATNK